MGTGSGFYDDQMMRNGRCPHCFVTVRFESATPLYEKGSSYVAFSIEEPEPFEEGSGLKRSFAFFQCPNCHDVVVWMRRSTCEADRVFLRVYPPRSNHPPAPREVPGPSLGPTKKRALSCHSARAQRRRSRVAHYRCCCAKW